jgi:AraC family transcriptional regulator
MIGDTRGVAVNGRRAWADSCVEEIVYDARWRAEPGWFAFDADSPTICMAASEAGGRCEFRAEVDQPGRGGYFGPGALVFAAAGSRVVIYAAELRQARICCFATRPSATGYLPQAQIAAIDLLTSHYMFRNERIRTCAALLDRGGGLPGQETYTRSLATALFAAAIELAEIRRELTEDWSLSGTHWGAICEYIRDHLDRPIALEAAANVVQMPPERFGRAFRKATGMSLRQWQVDCRVRRAQRLLLDNPREGLAKVAVLCGFTDQSHFSRAFLKTAGVTPTAWLHSWK